MKGLRSLAEKAEVGAESSAAAVFWHLVIIRHINEVLTTFNANETENDKIFIKFEMDKGVFLVVIRGNTNILYNLYMLLLSILHEHSLPSILYVWRCELHGKFKI